MKDITLSQIHIEAARNSTDDFNLFHDKNRWNWVENNPFNGPIALGFQLGCLVEDCVKKYRKDATEDTIQSDENIPYSFYELTFAGVVKPGDSISIDVKGTRSSIKEGITTVSNRVLVKASGKAVLLGFKKDVSELPIALPSHYWDPAELRNRKDRSFDESTGYFLKRKYMIVGNAKNFLTSAFAEQSEYIDEFADKVCFPEMYPLSLISSALLERAQAKSHDLIKNPMIYASHKLCIDKRQLKALRSNDSLNILISPEIEEVSSDVEKISHLCIGFCNNSIPLFIAQIYLLPLASLTK